MGTEKAKKAFEALGFKNFEEFGTDGVRAKNKNVELIISYSCSYDSTFAVFTEWERKYGNIAVNKEFNLFRVSIYELNIAVNRVHAFWKKNGIDLKPKRGK